MEKKNIIFVCISILIIILIFFGSIMVSKKEKTFEEKYGNKVVQIKVKDYGNIIVELDHDSAPITVENFVSLIENKFYDGLTFHRIIEGFMIQGGGINQDGEKQLSKTIKGEFLENGVENNLSHERGVISLARGEDYNSGSSQFFITVADKGVELDGRYAAFGKVVSGMDVVDKIVEESNPIDDNGSIDLDERPVITSIRLISKANTYNK